MAARRLGNGLQKAFGVLDDLGLVVLLEVQCLLAEADREAARAGQERVALVRLEVAGLHEHAACVPEGLRDDVRLTTVRADTSGWAWRLRRSTADGLPVSVYSRRRRRRSRR